MFLKKILPKNEIISDIDVWLINNDEEVFLGTAFWNGEILISENMQFSVHNKVWKYKFSSEGKLTYWINAAFLGADDFDD